MVDKVIATEAALALIADLQAEHGPVFFHQSGGCCDNSAAKSQYEYWKHTQLILDVIDGQGGTFSLEGSTGKAFHTRSRLFTDEEFAEIQAGENDSP
jgi:uncharacterized protein (DUF779 family)